MHWNRNIDDASVHRMKQGYEHHARSFSCQRPFVQVTATASGRENGHPERAVRLSDVLRIVDIAATTPARQMAQKHPNVECWCQILLRDVGAGEEDARNFDESLVGRLLQAESCHRRSQLSSAWPPPPSGCPNTRTISFRLRRSSSMTARATGWWRASSHTPSSTTKAPMRPPALASYPRRLRISWSGQETHLRSG